MELYVMGWLEYPCISRFTDSWEIHRYVYGKVLFSRSCAINLGRNENTTVAMAELVCVSAGPPLAVSM